MLFKETDRKSFCLVCVLMMLPLAGSGIDIYSPSLPALSHYFMVSTQEIKWTISIYIFGLCLGQLILGTMSDCYGRKPVLLTCLAVFGCISFALTYSTGIHWLWLFRLCQGFMVGGVAASARSVVTDRFEHSEIAGISATMALAWSMGPMLAPVVGGYLESIFNWKASFYVLSGYASILFIMIVLLKETSTYRVRFCYRRMLANYRDVLSNRQYVGSIFIMASAYSILIAYPIIMPFIVQNQLGGSAIVYGNATFFLGFSYMVGALVNRYLSKKYTPIALIRLGLMVSLIFVFLMMLVYHTFALSLWTLYIPTVCLTVSVGVVFPSCLSQCISLFPDKAGVASALAGSGLMFLTAITSSLTEHLHVESANSLSVYFLVLILISIAVFYFFFPPADPDANEAMA